MNTFKRNICNMLFLMTFFTVQSRSGNHTVSTIIEVTQTAMNRYLQSQYNAAGFPRDISVSNTNYKIYLTLPEVILTTGNAKLQMIFDVKDGSTLMYHFVVQPSINIPSSQITALQVQAFLTNLQSTLDAVTLVLPPWVKTNIIANYDTRGWTVYPSKLLDQVSTTWFAQRGLAINITDLALAQEVINGVFRLTISIPMTAKAPSFYAQIAQNQYGAPVVVVPSIDIGVTVDELRIYSEASTLVQTITDDVLLTKNINKFFPINFTPYPAEKYIIWVIFRIEDITFMVRTFRAMGDGSNSTLVDSIN